MTIADLRRAPAQDFEYEVLDLLESEMANNIRSFV
jgi:hypothetical protein